MLHGLTVTLFERTKTGEVDAFGAAIYTETPVEVKNVLIGEPSPEEALSATRLYGKRSRFVLGIPKGDTHNWEDAKVTWVDGYGRTITVQTFGFMVTGVEALIPTPWHGKVMAAEYGG